MADKEKTSDRSSDDTRTITGQPEVDLRNSTFAALLAWLWPGAGHFYQRRYAKAMLFMICILSTFFYGLLLGGGRVVYASWKPNDHRWQYACQLGTGIPALPAIVQSFKTQNDGKPLFPLAERFPPGAPRDYEIMTEKERANWKGNTLTDGLMAPPAGPSSATSVDVLGKWHEELLFRFELGTLFTVIAGLMNILAIYDAYAGPAFDESNQPGKKKSDDDDENKENDA